MEQTKPWKSKTLWIALLNAAVAFSPSAREWVATHPDYYMLSLSGVFAVLRALTKGKISID